LNDGRLYAGALQDVLEIGHDRPLVAPWVRRVQPDQRTEMLDELGGGRFHLRRSSYVR
jgi:hypothetical protein